MNPSTQISTAAAVLIRPIIKQGFTASDTETLQYAVRAFGKKTDAMLSETKLGRMLDNFRPCSFILPLTEYLRTGKFSTPHIALLMRFMHQLMTLNIQNELDAKLATLMNDPGEVNENKLRHFITGLVCDSLPEEGRRLIEEHDPFMVEFINYIVDKIKVIYTNSDGQIDFPPSLSTVELKELFTRVIILTYTDSLQPVLTAIRAINLEPSNVRPGRMRLAKNLRDQITAELITNDEFSRPYPDFMRRVGIRALCNYLTGSDPKNFIAQPNNFEFYLSLLNAEQTAILKAAAIQADTNKASQDLDVILQGEEFAGFNKKLAYLGEEIFAQSWLTSQLLALGGLFGDLQTADPDTTVLNIMSLNCIVSSQVQGYDLLSAELPTEAARVQNSTINIDRLVQSFLDIEANYVTATPLYFQLAATELFKPILAKIALVSDQSQQNIALRNAMRLREVCAERNVFGESYNRIAFVSIIAELESLEPNAIANRINALVNPLNVAGFYAQAIQNMPPGADGIVINARKNASVAEFIAQFARPVNTREIRTKLLVKIISNPLLENPRLLDHVKFNKAEFDNALDEITIALLSTRDPATSLALKETLSFLKEILNKCQPDQQQAIALQLSYLYQISAKLSLPELHQLHLKLRNEIYSQNLPKWSAHLVSICKPLAESKSKDEFIANLRTEWRSSAIVQAEILLKQALWEDDHTQLTTSQKASLYKKTRVKIEKIMTHAIANETTQTIILANEFYRLMDKYHKILVVPTNTSSYIAIINNRSIPVTGTVYRICNKFKHEFGINISSVEVARNTTGKLTQEAHTLLRTSQKTWWANALALSFSCHSRPAKLPEHEAAGRSTSAVTQPAATSTTDPADSARRTTAAITRIREAVAARYPARALAAAPAISSQPFAATAAHAADAALPDAMKA